MEHSTSMTFWNSSADEPGSHGHDGVQWQTSYRGTGPAQSGRRPIGPARSGTDLPFTASSVQSAGWTGTARPPGHQDQPPDNAGGHDADEHGRCVVPYPPLIECFTTTCPSVSRPQMAHWKWITLPLHLFPIAKWCFLRESFLSLTESQVPVLLKSIGLVQFWVLFFKCLLNHSVHLFLHTVYSSNIVCVCLQTLVFLRQLDSQMLQEWVSQVSVGNTSWWCFSTSGCISE